MTIRIKPLLIWGCLATSAAYFASHNNRGVGAFVALAVLILWKG